MAPKDDGRKRQAETIKERYGPDYYQRIAKMRVSSPHLGRWASWKRWHPERFGETGTLLPEWEKEFYATNDKRK